MTGKQIPFLFVPFKVNSSTCDRYCNKSCETSPAFPVRHK